LLWAGHFNAAYGIFAFAGLSDAVDGFLAKRFNHATRLGRILDPAADKALMLAAFVTLAILDDVPAWLAVLVIVRDVLIVAGLLVAVAARAPIAVKPLMIGKLCSAVQVIYVGLHLAALAFEFSLARIIPADAYVVAAIAVLSLLAYFTVWLNAMRAAKSAPRA
jgi:cardiolipin synthase